MIIRTILNFGRWQVVKHFLCEICEERFIMTRQIHSGFKFSEAFDRDCIAHSEFCRLKQSAKTIIGKYYETQNKNQ